jgi:hypothetical protein
MKTFTLSLLLVLVLSLFAGCASTPMVTVTKYVNVPEYIVTEKIVTVTEKIVTVTNNVTVEVEKETLVIPREFNSVDEAQTWLDANHLPTVIFVGATGEAILNPTAQDNRYNCNDYAQDLQEKALRDGYLLTYCPVMNGRVWETFNVTDVLACHIGLIARIGDNYYYVEPIPEHETSYQLIYMTHADRSGIE